MTARVVFVARKRTLAAWAPRPPSSPAEVDAAQQRMRTGDDVWIVQSHALLKAPLQARGYTVSLEPRFPAGAIAVAHWDMLNGYGNGSHRSRVVGVRADRAPLYGCECVIVQNDLLPDADDARYIPLWPQPGLLARDPARGDRVETLAYFGRIERIPPWLASEAFRARLAALGVRLRLSDREWNDYRDVDAVVSMRTESPLMLRSKPASKLSNAWLAGVPALLGDEPAFRSLRHGNDDYFQVRDADDVVAAIAVLQREPGRYRAMVTNGNVRGAEFTRDAVAARWVEVISGLAQRPAPAFRWWRFTADKTRQRFAARRFRREHLGNRAPAGSESA